MKILLLAENWPPRVGGIENYLTHMAQGLPKESVQVIAPISPQPLSSLEERGVQRKRFFWPINRPAWLPLFISIYRQAKRAKYDAVLCGKALFEGLVGYYLKKHLGIPYVVCTYAMEIETWAKHGGQKRKLMRVLKNADRVVYINEVTKQSLLNLGVTEKQLVKIWPGVDDAYFAKPTEEQSAQVLKKYAVKKPYILCVSRLIKRKGIDVLIEAFAALDQIKHTSVQLVIVGDGPERQALQELVERNMMNKSISFLGQVPDADLPALYASAEFFALTPRPLDGDFEGFGIVYLEAAAAGLPVIAAKTGGASEAVVHKETGLVVQPDSVPAVKEALEYLLTKSDEPKRLGDQGRKRAWDQFRWSKRSLLVKGLFDALLAERVLRRK